MAPTTRGEAAKAPESQQSGLTPISPQVSTTHQASSSSGSAVHRVFAVVELLEHIFLDVADVTKTKLELKGGDGLVAQPSRQLIALTRVNRLFRDIILGSTKLEAAKFSPLLTTSNEHGPLEWIAHILGLDFQCRSTLNKFTMRGDEKIAVLQLRNLYLHIHGDVYLPKKLKGAKRFAFANPEASWRQIPYSSAETPDPVCLMIKVKAKHSHYYEHLVMQKKRTMTLGAVYDWLMGILARSEQGHTRLGPKYMDVRESNDKCSFRVGGACFAFCSGNMHNSLLL